MPSSDGSGLSTAPSGGSVAARSASADFPPGKYLWATTSTQTVIYDRATSPPTAMKAIDNDPTGNLVRGPVNDVVYVATSNGIRTYVASTAVQWVTFRSSPGQGYAQVGLSPDGATLYGLRTGGTGIDVFAADTLGTLVTSITLPGRATGMSDPQPGTGAVIVIGNVVDEATGTCRSAAVRTSDYSVSYLDTGSTQVVDGTVWSPDGGHAYLAMGGSGVPARSAGTRHPPSCAGFR